MTSLQTVEAESTKQTLGEGNAEAGAGVKYKNRQKIQSTKVHEKVFDWPKKSLYEAHWVDSVSETQVRCCLLRSF